GGDDEVLRQGGGAEQEKDRRYHPTGNAFARSVCLGFGRLADRLRRGGFHAGQPTILANPADGAEPHPLARIAVDQLEGAAPPGLAEEVLEKIDEVIDSDG